MKLIILLRIWNLLPVQSVLIPSLCFLFKLQAPHTKLWLAIPLTTLKLCNSQLDILTPSKIAHIVVSTQTKKNIVSNTTNVASQNRNEHGK